MARMFPTRLPASVLENPGRQAEIAVFEALRQTLDDSCHVYYSVGWLLKDRRGGHRDGEADFVVAHPSLGVLVLEVKGGGIRHDGASGQWASESRGGALHAIKDPYEQAATSKHALLAKLKEHPSLRSQAIPISHAVAFPDSRELGRPLGPRDAAITLFARDIPNAGSRLAEVMSVGRRPQDSDLGPNGLAIVESVLAPTFELSTPLGARLSADDRQLVALTENQFALLSFISSHARVAVSGGAGTGKTMLALEKARRLVAEGMRVLLTCYNQPLAAHLRASVAGTPCDGIEISTFHELCARFSKAAGIDLRQYPNQAPSAFFEKDLPDSLVAALDRVTDRFDAIVVDEGQDFARTWWVPLELCLRDHERGILYIFYDDNQHVYARDPELPTNLARFALTENCRNTQRIHRVAVSFYRGGVLTARGPEGQPVEVIRVTTPGAISAEIGRLLHRIIEDGQTRPEDVVVLVGKPAKATTLGITQRAGRFRLAGHADRRQNDVLLETVNRFKGLERPVVVLAEIEQLDTSKTVDAAALYVGLSRARVYLGVIATARALSALGMTSDSERG